MKQFSMLLLATVCAICSLAFFSCNNEKSNHGQGPETPTIDSCLLNSAVKEKACLDEFEKCKNQADNEMNSTIEGCNHLPPPNKLACISDAIAKNKAQTAQCIMNLRACLTELQKYRSACLGQFTKQPDTK